ncbi:hypothetical protein [Chelatococcus asaccharovorans]|uniref:Uncharacterized protein n=1 Tax=Chelatococcus asaccharovorans TaxID=28210 RepID=A0A2V3U5E0_9HYPH|nr:hypothetical protein [Chelatococcus asaccharovorans]MBS7704015.1 hypothetical protein [Chelatococcus asaccharovorans]PXW58180.1 hypothetical protein C7450_106356 [Chelatococcus asaccharovorans]
MVSRLAVVVLTACLTALPALAAPCIGSEGLPGVAAKPRSAADRSQPARAADNAAGRTARPSQDCETALGSGPRPSSDAVTRKSNALKFGDTEIRINGRVRAEGAYAR